MKKKDFIDLYDNYFINKNRIDINKVKLEVFELIKKSLLTIKNNGIIFTCGNGGSTAEADHLTAELIVKYNKVRAPIKSLNLNNSFSSITAHSNDFDYDSFLTRHAQAMTSKKDMVICFSTSGKSKNILSLIKYLNSKNIPNFLLTGLDFEETNYTGLTKKIIIDSKKTSYIQETHLEIIHILCEAIDRIK